MTHNCLACGKEFPARRQTSRYCSRRCAWSKNGGQNKKDQVWWKNNRGYIEGYIWITDGSQLRVKAHRFIMEGLLGRPLLASEDVHHVNGVKDDNRPSNLLLVSHGDHSRMSNLGRTYEKGYRLQLTDRQRHARSLRAVAMGLSEMGRAAIARATTTTGGK